MKTFVNLTPHTINEVTSGTKFPVSGQVARVKASTETVDIHAGIPLYQSVFGEIEGLPDPQEGVMYIVSSLALNAVPKERVDVVAPGNVTRNENGEVVGCCGFRVR
jgi:hypothetical protein